MNSTYTNDLDCHRSVVTTDGDDGYLLEDLEEPLVEHLSIHEEVMIFEPAEPFTLDDERSAMVIILGNGACACLTLEIRCTVGRCYTGRREKPNHERKAGEKTYKTYL